MRRTVIWGLMLYLWTQMSFAQGVTECGTPNAPLLEIPESEKHHCFTVGAVQSSCTKLWLRINIHFFVEDNCQGTIDPKGSQHIPIENAYAAAEDLINRANVELEENYEQWNQIPDWGLNSVKPPQCVPIRYALSGVYVHCNTQAKNTGGTAFNINDYFQPNFGVNTSSEFNAYIVLYPGGPNGSSNGIPGTAFSAENFTTAVFNHEMGHVLRLSHSHINDNVADTPPIHFNYDFNCDGDLSDNYPSPGVGRETDPHQCWFFGYGYNVTAADRGFDYDGDGVDDYTDFCNIPDPNCAPFPCCEWKYINNNIMSYSSYTDCCAAYTEGQITRMLELLSTETGCEYIESITDDICLPPMSNIHVLPNETVNEDCAYCFQLGASMHDKYYKIDFYAPNGSLQFSTDWREGPAGTYCISRSVKYATQYNHGFQTGIQYTAVLTTENDCGEESAESFNFILPQLPSHGCQVSPPRDLEIKSLYPNPFIEIVNLEYKTERSGNLSAWLIPDNYGSDILLDVEYVNGSGTFTKSYSTQNVPSGVYYLVLDLDGTVIGSTVIKI